MKSGKYALGLGVVAVAAFLVGRSDLTLNSAAIAQHDHDHDHGHAHAQAGDDAMSGEMMEMMERMHTAGEPGPQHEVLNALIGEWEGSFSWSMAPGVPAMEMPGKVKREWVLDGRYVKETVESSFEGQAFHGMGFVGYDNTTGEYQFVWMDSHSTGIYTETGSYDPTSKTLMTWSRHINPATNRMMHSASRIDLSSKDRQTMKGQATGPDGQWFTMFEGDMKRIK
jgi:hypothetical protein